MGGKGVSQVHCLVGVVGPNPLLLTSSSHPGPPRLLLIFGGRHGRLVPASYWNGFLLSMHLFDSLNVRQFKLLETKQVIYLFSC